MVVMKGIGGCFWGTRGVYCGDLGDLGRPEVGDGCTATGCKED